MKAVAQNRPEKLGLRVAGLPQQLETLGRWLLQDAAHDFFGLSATGHVVGFGGVESQDVWADFLVVTRARFLPQGTELDQLAQHGRRGVGGVKRIVGFVGAQVVLQGLDDVNHGVQPHHIGGAECG